MAEMDIDRLQVQIEASADKGVSAIDKLINKLGALSSAFSSALPSLTSMNEKLSNAFAPIARATHDLNACTTAVNSLTTSLSLLSGVDMSKATNAIEGIYNGVKRIEGLGNETSDIATAARSISSLESSLGKINPEDINGKADSIEKISSSLQLFKDSQTIGEGINESATAVNRFASALKKVGSVDIKALQGSTKALASTISRISKSAKGIENLTSFSASVNKVVSSINKLDKIKLDSIANNIKELSKAMNPLTEEMIRGAPAAQSYANAVNAMSGRLARLKPQGTALNTTALAAQNINKAFSFGKFMAIAYGIKEFGTAIGGAVNSINSYIEDMNLFTVAMGENARQASVFTQELQTKLGVNAGEAARFMGTFNQLALSFGISSDKAYILSKNLTQLSYDYASFLNISASDAAQKLRSGLVGETEPLRAIGKDLSVARLQLEAMNLGLNQNVSSMTQADKALLRYIVTMKQSTMEMGDMARTLQSPANMFRVLAAQVQLASQAIGSIFIPILTKLLPYAIAVTRVIGALASALAGLLGFKMPEFTTPDADTDLGLGDIAGGLDDIGNAADKANKKLNYLISGFDELNIMTKKTESAGRAGGLGGIGGLGDLDLPDYDMFKDWEDSKIDDIFKDIMDWLNNLRLDPLTTISDLIWNFVGGLLELGKSLLLFDFPALLGGLAAGLLAFGLTGNLPLAIAIGALTAALMTLMPHEAQIEAMSGLFATLAGALLMPFSKNHFWLATALSLLAVSGLVKLLGKDNAIRLLGSALMGLMAGFTAFTFTGDIGLGIVVGAAVAALTALIDLVPGLEAAPAALVGVSAALVAFKWGKWTQGNAGILGIGAAVAAFAQLSDIAPPLQVALTGLGTAIMGFGAAIQLGFGTTGIIITTAVSALGGLGLAAWMAGERMKKARLDERFGDIKLSAEECEEIAERLTTTEWTMKLDASIEAREKLEGFETEIKDKLREIQKMNWMVGAGIKLSIDEQESYKQAVDSYIESVQSYAKERNFSLSMSIAATMDTSGQEYQTVINSVNEIASMMDTELMSLGSELQQTVNDAFADGLLDMEESGKIQEILANIDKLHAAIAEHENQAELLSLKLQYGEANIDAESFQRLAKEVQEKTAERTKQIADEVAKTTLTLQSNVEYAEMKLRQDPNNAELQRVYDEAQTALDTYMSGKEYKLRIAKMQIENADVLMSVLENAFGDALSQGEDAFNSGQISDDIANIMQGAIVSGINKTELSYKTVNLDGLSKEMAEIGTLLNAKLTESMAKVDPNARADLHEMVQEILPSTQELMEQVVQFKSVGEAIPKEIIDALNQQSQLLAMAGETTGLDWMIAQMLSPEKFTEYMTTSEIRGQELSEAMKASFLSGIELTTGEAGQVIATIGNTSFDLSQAENLQLAKNLHELGVNVIIGENGFVGGISGSVGEIANSTSSTLSEGINTGISSATIVAQDSLFNSMRQIMESEGGAVGGVKIALEAIRIATDGTVRAGTADQTASMVEELSASLYGSTNQMFAGGSGANGGILASEGTLRETSSQVGNNTINEFGNQKNLTTAYNVGAQVGREIARGMREQILGAIEGINRLIGLISKDVGDMADDALDSVRKNRAVGKGNSSSTPKLASGGVVKAPTYAMVGEYPNARNNPEIVAPESTIESVVAKANMDMLEAIIQVMRESSERGESTPELHVYIGDEEVGKPAARWLRNQERLTGKNPGKL